MANGRAASSAPSPLPERSPRTDVGSSDGRVRQDLPIYGISTLDRTAVAHGADIGITTSANSSRDAGSRDRANATQNVERGPISNARGVPHETNTAARPDDIGR